MAALARNPRVLGIKNSAADLQRFHRFLAVRRQRPNFRVLQGSEHLMAASLLGADGLVPGLVNVAPALFIALPNAAGARDMDACAACQERIEDLWTLHHTHGHWLPALRAACAALGLGSGWPALAFTRADSAQRQASALIVQRHVATPTS